MQERDRFDLADTAHEKLSQATISRLRVRAFSRRRPLLVYPDSLKIRDKFLAFCD
jgi:hypothetical protein